MPTRETALTAAAGEHYVAYCLSSLGYPTALTRGGSPTVDLMLGDITGHQSVMIQVKTSNWAWRPRKKVPQNSHWLWDVGAKAKNLKADNILYCFVDLKSGNNLQEKPDVFIVPSIEVSNRMGEDWKRYMYWIPVGDKNYYYERWDRITSILTPPVSAIETIATIR